MIRCAVGALVLLLATLSGACAARGGVPRPFPGAALPPHDAGVRRGDPGLPPGAGESAPPPPITAVGPPLEIVSTALQFQGSPYRNGGSDPSGFDCSGFVQYVFAQHGAALPREVREQFHVGREIELKDVQPGDLLFFETVTRGASHVGMVVDGDQFVHAPSSRGVVRVERFTASYWAMRFVGARRVGNDAQVSRR